MPLDPAHGGLGGTGDNAEFIRVAMTLGERLRAMEDLSRERNEGMRRIEAKLDAQGGVLQAQQIQLTQMTADISHVKQTSEAVPLHSAEISEMKLELAVMKNRHDNFWRGVTMLVGILTTACAALGWVISQIMSVWPNHGGH